MNCEKIQDAILEDLPGTAGSGEFLENHIKKCPSCREFARMQEKIRAVVRQGLQGRAVPVKSGSDFVKLFNKRVRSVRAKVAVLAAAVILALLALLPVIQPTLAQFYPGFLRNIFRYIEYRDDLVRASREAPLLNLSVTDQGITFTVHQLFADSVRLVLVASWEDPGGLLGKEFHPVITAPSLGVGFEGSKSTVGPVESEVGRYFGIFIFYPSRTPEMAEKVWIGPHAIGNLHGNWRLEVPIYWYGDEQMFSGLSVEKDHFRFSIKEIRFGGTVTRVDWEFRDTLFENRDDQEALKLAGERGYRLITKDVCEIKDLWVSDAPIWSFLVDGRIHLEIIQVDGEVIRSSEPTGQAYYRDNLVSSREYYLPAGNPSGMKLVLKELLMQKTDPVIFSMEASGGSWNNPAQVIEGTTVKVESIDPARGEITLSYQFGRLIKMASPTLQDGRGRLYAFREMRGQVPGYKDFRSAQPLPLEEFLEQLPALVRYQTLYFDPLPGDTGSLRLFFDEVFFISDQEWVIKIPQAGD